MVVRGEPPELTVTIQAAEPIQGSVADGEAAVHPFTGWLGLISALEEALASVHRGDFPNPEEDSGR
jgi:hypothetical protein